LSDLDIERALDIEGTDIETKPGDRQDVYDALAKPDHPLIHPDGACSRRQMRCCEADELPRCDDFGLLPELRKMLPIAGNEVVSTSAGDGAAQ
jgi:hypothetical protein